MPPTSAVSLPTAAQRWLESATYDHGQFSAERMAAERRASVSVCLPARECAPTIGRIVERVVGLRELGVVDELVVIDAESADGTARIAADAGATVYQEAELLSEFGPPLGKGDAMWRGLSVLSGELVCYLDGDIENFADHFVTGVLGPLVYEPRVSFVKGFYRRSFKAGDAVVPEGGGRVNHLVARPALALFYPDLVGVRQPLAGETAARRELLERLPFTTGYGVETAMLIDAYRAVGLGGLAQVDLGSHQNANKPLLELVPMAQAVLTALALRLEREGRLAELDPAPTLGDDDGGRAVELVERPALGTLRAAQREAS